MSFFYTDQHRRWHYALQIGGLPIRYTSSSAVTQQQIENHPSFDHYTDVVAILTDDGVGGLDERVDLMRSLGDFGAVTVRLAQQPNTVTDPGVVFARSGRRAATAFALVTETVPAAQEVPFEIKVNRDLSGLSYPRLLHIGQEAFWCSGFDGEDPLPTDADPFRLTVTGRALGGTRLRTHRVNADNLDFPILTTDEIVSFEQRPAVLWCEPADGSSLPIAIARGYLDVPPEVEADGSVTVQIVPLTGLLDQEITLTVPAEETHLTEGYHLFSARAGSQMEVYQTTPDWVADIRDDTLADSQELDFFADDIDRWQAAFDPSLPFEHPRAGDVALFNDVRRFYKVTGASTDGGAEDETLDLASGPAVDINEHNIAFARLATETRRAYLIEPGGDDEILTWPGVPEEGDDSAFFRINSALAVADHLGDAGAPVSVLLVGGAIDDGEGPASLSARLERRSALAEHQDEGIVAVLDQRIDELVAGASYTWDDPAIGPDILPWSATSGWDVDRAVRGLPRYWSGGRRGREARVQDVLWFPLVWDSPLNPTTSWVNDLASFTRVPVGSAVVDFPLYDIAKAFYSRGEPAVLVDDLIDITDGSVVVRSMTPRADRLTDNQGGIVAFRARVSAIEPVELTIGPRTGDTVYKLVFEDPDQVPSFGEFSRPGMESGIVIRATREADFGSPMGALRWLLTNEQAYGLSDDEVDLASIDRFPESPWFQPFELPSINSNDGSIKARDLIDGILRLTRSAFVMRTDSIGRCRLTLISTGLASETEAIERIAAGDWASDTTPESKWDRNVVNRLEIETHYDSEEEEFRVKTAFNEQASRSMHGKQATESIKAYGFQPANPSGDLFWMAQGIFRTFAEPLRVWKGRVSTAKGTRLSVGSVVSISSPHLKGYRGEPVVDEIGRVVSRRLDLWSEGCDVEVVSYGLLGVGWNAGLKVTEVVNATTVVVDANAYSSALHPVTGEDQEDLDAFEEGTVVYCEPYADSDGGVTTLIVSIDRATNTVTTDDNHGLAVGDSIVTTIYSNASELLKRYAFMSDGEEYQTVMS